MIRLQDEQRLALLDADAAVRAQTLKRLATATKQLDTRPIVPFVCWLILEDPDPSVRAACLLFLAKRAEKGFRIDIAIPTISQVMPGLKLESAERGWAETALTLARQHREAAT